MKYLFIFEDGTVMGSNTLTKEDVESVNAGVLTVVDVQDETVLMGDDEWTKLPLVDET